MGKNSAGKPYGNGGAPKVFMKLRYQDYADLFGLSVSYVKDLRANNQFDPSNLDSVIGYYLTATKRGKKTLEQIRLNNTPDKAVKPKESKGTNSNVIDEPIERWQGLKFIHIDKSEKEAMEYAVDNLNY